MTRKVYSIREAGAFVRMSPQMVAKAIKSGDLQSVKIGGRRVVTDEQIDAWLKANVEKR